jgi:3-oxoacyl-[acyl-carrier protein] reductase
MHQLNLNDRVAVITGGARGIGLAIAERCAASGAKVAIWDVDLDEALRVAGRLDGFAARVDVTEYDAIDAAAIEVERALGPVDILVNNAGITGPNMPVDEYGIADWRRVIDVDLNGVFLCSRALVPRMRVRNYGRIVNIASIAGKEGNPNAAAYSAAKAGVIGLTKSLGKELAATGIRVNCITPAAAETDIFKQMTEQQISYMLSKIPMGRFVQVEEIAALACWLASEECSFSTGAVFDISGGRATY